MSTHPSYNANSATMPQPYYIPPAQEPKSNKGKMIKIAVGVIIAVVIALAWFFYLFGSGVGSSAARVQVSFQGSGDNCLVFGMKNVTASTVKVKKTEVLVKFNGTRVSATKFGAVNIQPGSGVGMRVPISLTQSLLDDMIAKRSVEIDAQIDVSFSDGVVQKNDFRKKVPVTVSN